MDEESKSSIRSGESVPNPIYEEIVVDSTSTDNLGISIEKNNEKYTVNANDETTAMPTFFDAESNEDDEDDNNYGENNESGNDDEDDNHSSSSNSNSSSSSKSSATSYSSCSITDERSKDDNNDNDDDDRLTDKKIVCKNSADLSSLVSTQVETTSTKLSPSKKMQQKILEETKKAEKSTNTKLLLKKAKGYEVTPTVSAINSSGNVVLSNNVADDTSSTVTQMKSPIKPVFLVRIVSSTPTGPAYTTATYSPAGAAQAQLLQQVSSSNSDINSSASSTQQQIVKVSIQENSIELKSNIDEKLIASTTSSTLETLPAATDNIITDNTKDETTDEKSNSISSKTATFHDDPDDIDSIKSDQDQEIKSSTPKIARELMQLQKTVSESKVLTEYINDSAVTKNRKSKKLLLSSNKNISGIDNNEQLSPINQRRSRSRSSSKSRSRIDSPCNDISSSVNAGAGDNDSRSPLLGNWPSDERINKRTNMRSQNSEFIQKHMKFLNRCNNADAADTDNSDTELQSNETKSIPPPIESQLDIIKKNYLPPPKRGWDAFCWKCATCGDLLPCSKCTRSYHIRCLKSQAPNKIDKEWVCPECNNLEAFMRGILRSGKVCLAADHLNQLMEFALKRMKQQGSHEKFLDNFDEDECPDYYKYIVNPVTLSTIQMKLENRSYKYSEELVSEVKWIQHNATIYFGNNNKITTFAKQLVKVCRQEVNEIETCPECYYNANTKNDWFIEVCSRPHILLWAKLKGFPYWPAKSMGCTTTVVNVRFFGAHDRAHVPIKDCYLYCEKDPNPITKQQNKRNLIAGSIKEVDDHIKKIILKFGKFKYAPFKTLYDPNNELKQLETMIPGIIEYIENTQLSLKPALTYKIVKTADNHLSMIKKTDSVNGELRRLSGSNDSTNNIGNIVTNKLLKKTNCASVIENEKKSSVILAGNNANITNRKNNEEITKSYEVVAKTIDETSDANNKVNSVILKRKSDNWNAITVPSSSTAATSPSLSGKRFKMNSDDKDKNNTEKLEDEVNSISNNVAEKRKRSSDEIQLHQTQKPKLNSNENEIESIAAIATKSILVTSNNATINKKSNLNKLEENLTIRIGNSKITGKPIVLSSSLNKNHQKEQNTSHSEDSTKLNDKEKCNTETQSKEIMSDNNVIVKIEQESENIKINKSNNESNSNEKNISQVMETKGNQLDKIQYNKRNTNYQSKNQNVKTSELKKLQTVETTESIITINKKSTKENESIRSNKINDSSTTLPNQTTSSEVSTIAQQQSLNKEKSTNEINSNTKNTNKILVNVHNLIKTPLIPFTEIKTEKPDTDDENQNNDNPTISSTSATITTSVTSVTEKNTESNLQQKMKITSKTPSDPLSKQSTTMTPSSNTGILPSNTESVVIKTEVCSDNEEDPLRILATTNSSSALPAKSNISLNSSDKLNSQRICVKDFATIRTQSQSLPSRKIEKKLPPATLTRLDMKKRNQRARKSFPNKGNMPAPMMPLPLSTGLTTKSSSNTQQQQQQQQQSSKQNIKSMVYIPLDTRTTTSLQKPIPIPLLTAVSKMSVNNQQQQQQQQLPTSTVTPTVTPNATTTMTTNTNPVNIAMTKVTTTSSSSLLNTITTGSTTTTTVADTQTNSGNNDKELSKTSGHHMLSGFVTPSLASAITETIVRGPPKLAPKPSGPLRSDGDFVFPTEAGPVCKTLMENAHKMTDFFRTVIEDTLSDMANNGTLEAKVQLLELEIEKLKHSHTKELTELKHNTDLMLCEMRNSLENEKQRLISETRKQCEIERIRAVEEAKKKQWCANCSKEAQFYCCWNTSYCDYPCQQKHWPRHMNSCAQNDNPDASAQKVGVKIQSYNVKDKLNRLPKEIQIPRLPPNTFLRPASITAQAQRNAVPIHRLVSIPAPITIAPQPRFTLLNREGNWELMSATSSPQTSYHQPHRLQITTSSSSSSSSSSPSPSSTIMQEISNCGTALITGNSNNGKISSSTALALPPNINIIRSNKL